MIASHENWMWFISAIITIPAAAWLVVDVVRLRRALAEGKSAHDRLFGSIIGLCVALIGITGVLKYHLW